MALTVLLYVSSFDPWSSPVPKLISTKTKGACIVMEDQEPYPKTLIMMAITRAKALDAELVRSIEVFSGDPSFSEKNERDFATARRYNAAYIRWLESLPVE